MRRVLILGGVAIGVLLIAAAWLWLPAWDFLVEPVAPDVRDDVNRAIEAASESPEEQARLRLELAALEQEDAGRQSDLRNAIAQVGTALVAGSVAAWGAVAAWRQLQDNRRQADAARRETDEQLRLARDGQLTERFTRAVDQLGNEKSHDVRIGGIYALERIARDSRDSRGDRVTVAEVLAAFIRGHAPRQPSAPASHGDPDKAILELAARAADVHAALTVLGRLPAGPDPYRFDLQRTNLPHALLAGADLSHANLTHSDLACSTLRSAKIAEAKLADACDRRGNGDVGSDTTLHRHRCSTTT